MHQGVKAYQKVAQTIVPSRELEASLLLKMAAHLQMVKDNWVTQKKSLHSALYDNRRLWTILLTSATREENPLPQRVKQDFASLGLFVFKHSLETQIRPEKSKIDILIDINRQLAAGLSTLDAT
ncbi:MAG: flagellar biosynthesis regulator FlaF [Alphaproteobacteria bacterium]|nr:flagellar biosynthesis regulator FlaF [Alphaproteobacteria bacterium]